MIDARAMARRHAAELLLLAVGAGALGLAVCGGVAHAQEVAPVVADYPVDFNAIIWGGGGAGAMGLVGFLSWLFGKKVWGRLRRALVAEPDEEASAPVDGGGLRAALDALREEQREAHEAARKERGELRESIADLRTDLYPKHDDPLAVQVRQLAASTQAAPEAVKMLTSTVLDRLDKLEGSIRGASSKGGPDAR